MEDKKFKFVENKTPVTLLQERLIRNGITPRYDLIYDSTTRPCAQTKFTWRVKIEDVEAYGSGNTKKQAKQEAARNMLIQISGDEAISLLKKVAQPVADNFINQIGNLSMFCSRNSLPQPIYQEYESDGPVHIRQFFCDCRVSKYIETGIAKSKKDAKQRSAHQMYEQLLTKISNPNDSAIVEGRLLSELPHKIEKSDPWFGKSEKFERDEMEVSDNEEAGLSALSHEVEGTDTNVDPTREFNYQPGYRIHDGGEEGAGSVLPEFHDAETTGNEDNEELVEKKFKINISLFKPSMIVETAQKADGSPAAVDDSSVGMGEKSSEDIRNSHNGEVRMGSEELVSVSTKLSANLASIEVKSEREVSANGLERNQAVSAASGRAKELEIPFLPCKEEMNIGGEILQYVQSIPTPQSPTPVAEANNNEYKAVCKEDIEVKSHKAPSVKLENENPGQGKIEEEPDIKRGRENSVVNYVLKEITGIESCKDVDTSNLNRKLNSNYSEFPDEPKVSNYHHMMMTEHGIDLRGRILEKISELIEAMLKHGSGKNPQLVDEGLIILHDILLSIDLLLSKVSYKAQNGEFIVVIHVNSISEIVEMTKGCNLDEITRITFFKVIERLRKLLG